MGKRLNSIYRDSNDVQLVALLESSLGVADEEYPPEVETAMRALCLFPASFDGCAAAAVLNKVHVLASECSRCLFPESEQTYEETEDILGMLLEYSLLDFDLTTGRYHMNDLIRSHAYHKALAADSSSMDALREVFVRYYLVQLRACRTLYAQRPPTGDEEDPRRQAKEKATLLFQRERDNFEACAQILAVHPQLGESDKLSAKFAANYCLSPDSADLQPTSDDSADTSAGAGARPPDLREQSDA